MGADDLQTLRAFMEAEAYDGPSLIIAYSHCIAHGIDMATGMQHQKALVDSGQWLLYRHHPDRTARGENPLQIDSRAIKTPVAQFLRSENRFSGAPPELIEAAQRDVNARWEMYAYLAARK